MRPGERAARDLELLSRSRGFDDHGLVWSIFLNGRLPAHFVSKDGRLVAPD